ncbi:tRNA methyl transferase domain-containing protein [Ditylenchus destructor]|uniref:tRNA-5-taurinomethyluridine 2-sulfurtransferase n=1 Tax=Ditylenchus destructor TaxID=166010 RepID=A0AAD4MX79_9BILA|nr:tRNA methyl transferase domain-containing protein [Ditylenchus destructor]
MQLIRRIACAISGGVDSAVSALLLKQKGHNVVGIYMINWDHQDEEDSSCPRTKDQADAEEVCRTLGIELHIVNFVREYWNSVFVNMLENYKRGRTVVPDIDCNRYIKFDLLHKFAFDKLGVDAVATGHFARIKQQDPQDKIRLLAGRDPLRDQTYFLASLTQDQLRRSIFPVGDLLKTEVKQIAKEAGLLTVAEKKESVGICFVGKKKVFDNFLAKYIDPVENGRFVDEFCNELPGCSHSGIHNFTLGKRLRCVRTQKMDMRLTSCDGFYVSRIDPLTQTIHLCNGSHHPSLFATKFAVMSPHWISGDGKSQTEKLISEGNAANLEFRLQRNTPTIKCKLSQHPSNDEMLVVEPRRPIRAAADGQTCVFYFGDECLGCAEITGVVETLHEKSRSSLS